MKFRTVGMSLMSVAFLLGAAACTQPSGGGGGGGGGTTCAGGSSSSADLPDTGFVDSNCDGIDGNAAKAIFVSPSGNDANSGTSASSPKLTVTAAVAATTSSRDQVLVATGVYVEGSGIQLNDDVGIYGGYGPAFTSRAIGGTTIEGMGDGALAVGATGVVLQDVTVEGLTPGAAGASAYGIRVLDGSSVALDTVTAIGDDGVAGAVGTPSTPGINGPNGAAGGIPSTSNAGIDNEPLPFGTYFGGSGGTGGPNPTQGANGSGITGAVGGQTGQIGGPNGAFPCNGTGAMSGQYGRDGSAGHGGIGAVSSGGALAGDAWAGASGGQGVAPTHGEGGGGGGGCRLGGGGGGGGYGAIPGTGGGGGGGGGGSFGVYVAGGSSLTATDVTFENANGGVGGAGNTGADRTLGGQGGIGGGSSTPPNQTLGGTGGKGGDTGSAAGGGGGGEGGPAVGLYVSNDSTATTGGTTSFVSNGSPGVGGARGLGGRDPANLAAPDSSRPNGTAGVNGTAATRLDQP